VAVLAHPECVAPWTLVKDGQQKLAIRLNQSGQVKKGEFHVSQVIFVSKTLQGGTPLINVAPINGIRQFSSTS
jgi:coenzyme F420-reducing hydrogenase alpha subunit